MNRLHKDKHPNWFYVWHTLVTIIGLGLTLQSFYYVTYVMPFSAIKICLLCTCAFALVFCLSEVFIFLKAFYEIVILNKEVDLF